MKYGSRTIAWTAVLAVCVVSLSACSKEPTDAPAARSGSDARPADSKPAVASGDSAIAGKAVKVKEPAADNATPVSGASNPSKSASPPVPAAKRPSASASSNPMRTPSVDPANAEELRNAERVILTGWKGVKSISAKMKTHIDNRGEVKHQRTGEATIDFLYTDHGVLARMWNYDVIWADVNGQKVMTGDRTTKVYDGKFLYTLEELHDSKTVYKDFYRRSAFPALGGPDLLTTIKSFPTMKFQPKMDLDGKEVYRFMCRDEKVGFASFMFVDRKTGLLLRLLVADNVNKAKSVSDFTDYVFNPEFAPDHFTLKKPDDATFEDFTKPKAPPSPISVSTRHPETEDKTP